MKTKESTNTEKVEEQEQEQEKPVEQSGVLDALGFEVDTGPARRSQIDIGKLENVVAEAVKAMKQLSEAKQTSVTSIKLPLAKFNEKLGINTHNAHSLVYRIMTSKQTKPILEKYNIRLARRGAYNAPVENQAIAFVLGG